MQTEEQAPAEVSSRASVFDKYARSRFYADPSHEAFSLGGERTNFEIAVNSDGIIRNREIFRSDRVVGVVRYGACGHAKHTFRANRPNAKRWSPRPKCRPAMDTNRQQRPVGSPYISAALRMRG